MPTKEMYVTTRVVDGADDILIFGVTLDIDAARQMIRLEWGALELDDTPQVLNLLEDGANTRCVEMWGMPGLYFRIDRVDRHDTVDEVKQWFTDAKAACDATSAAYKNSDEYRALVALGAAKAKA